MANEEIQKLVASLDTASSQEEEAACCLSFVRWVRMSSHFSATFFLAVDRGKGERL